jgi:hypothetical protein
MTRKDYVLIAAAIVATQDRIKARANEGQSLTKTHDAEMQLRGVRRTAAHLADALAADNPNFDAARFLKACGYSGTTDERARAWREGKPIPPLEAAIDRSEPPQRQTHGR